MFYNIITLISPKAAFFESFHLVYIYILIQIILSLVMLIVECDIYLGMKNSCTETQQRNPIAF